MPTIDPGASAADAIVAHLASALSTNVSKVLKGWPEANVQLDLTTAPVVSVTPGRTERTACATRSLGSVTVDGVTTHTYRVAWLRIPCQIDLFAAYRVQRETVAQLIEAACNNRTPPAAAGIWLTQGSYYDRPITAELGEGADDVDGDTANVGEWRRTWDLVVETDEVKTVSHVAQERVDVTLTIDDGPAETLTLLE